MELTVFWTEFAKDKLDEIFEYYKLKSRSVNVARKLVDSIIDHTIILEKQPYIGQREDSYWTALKNSGIWSLKATRSSIGSTNRKIE